MADPEVRQAAGRLAAAGVPSPRRDAEELAAHVTGAPLGRLPSTGTFTAPQRRLFDQLVERRARREPLQHLTGSVGFRHLDLLVGPGVFVPRPETEVLTGWAVSTLREMAVERPVVADLGTGSGAIALSIVQEVPTAEVHAVELDPVALSWAGRNAAARAAAGDPPVTLHEGDLRYALPELTGRFDLVVSNPPYVGPDEIAWLDPEVRDHDPRLALVAGEEGLAALRAVAHTAGRLLRSGGALAMEHSDRQGDVAPTLVSATGGWRDVVDHPDLTGRPRFVTAWKV